MSDDIINRRIEKYYSNKDLDNLNDVGFNGGGSSAGDSETTFTDNREIRDRFSDVIRIENNIQNGDREILDPFSDVTHNDVINPEKDNGIDGKPLEERDPMEVDKDSNDDNEVFEYREEEEIVGHWIEYYFKEFERYFLGKVEAWLPTIHSHKIYFPEDNTIVYLNLLDDRERCKRLFSNQEEILNEIPVEELGEFLMKNKGREKGFRNFLRNRNKEQKEVRKSV